MPGMSGLSWSSGSKKRIESRPYYLMTAYDMPLDLTTRQLKIQDFLVNRLNPRRSAASLKKSSSNCARLPNRLRPISHPHRSSTENLDSRTITPIIFRFAGCTPAERGVSFHPPPQTASRR